MSAAPGFEVRHVTLSSPLGPLTLVESARGLLAVRFPGDDTGPADGERVERLACGAEDQLRAYFDAALHTFTLPLDPVGTAFQRAVWDEVARIAYGATRSYDAVARALGKPGAARAVGAANGRNPLPIVVPCHRVVGANGALTGYAGGLEAKRFLLELERRTASPQRALF